ncbi:MAG: dockerin, partial [Paenibacillus macerans]|nr:dockerin [Paenibacillus macerans]
MMSTQRKWLVALLSAMLTVSLTGTATALAETPQSSAITQSEASIQASLSDMPASLRPSIEWVYKNRMLKENSVGRKNLIFDQIFAGKGTINYVVRWQSAKNLTLQQRQDIERMLGRQLNNWTKHLKGYDGWPYGDIPVKVVGWAVANPAQILNKQPNEIVYTQTIVDELSKTDPRIPAALPVAPSALSRFDHFTDPNYAYPGGLD